MTQQQKILQSIGYFAQALGAPPPEPDHQSDAVVLCNLAMAYFTNCQIDHVPVNLLTSVSYYRETLKFRCVGHPDRPATLLCLTQVLMYHCRKYGYEE